METEQLTIFSDQMKPIGRRSRAEVHAEGLWHQTFHCWFIQQEPNATRILFQRRAASKKDYPNLLDTTTAGHLLADEDVEDGVREIREELGMSIPFSDLIPVGTMPDQMTVGDDFKDREFCQVFLYNFTGAIAQMQLQEEEVASIVQLELSECVALLQGERETIGGLEFNIVHSTTEPDERLVPTVRSYTRGDFCPHNPSYYARLFTTLQTLRTEASAPSHTYQRQLLDTL